MKTSNIILLSLFITGIAWQIVFDSLAVSVLRDIDNNNIPGYGYLLNNKTIIKPGDFDTLLIHTDGGIKINIMPGVSNTMYVSDGLDNNFRYSVKGRTLKLDISQPKSVADQSITLELNSLQTITTIHSYAEGWISYYELHLEGLKWPQLQINAQFPNTIRLENCTFCKLEINSQLHQEINSYWGVNFAGNNQVDTLKLNITGSGNVSLDNCGRNFNQIALSDSVRLNASLAVIQKIVGK